MTETVECDDPPKVTFCVAEADLEDRIFDGTQDNTNCDVSTEVITGVDEDGCPDP